MMTLRPRWASCVFLALAVPGLIVPPARAGMTYPDLLISDYPFTIDRFNLDLGAPDPGPLRQPGDPPATFVSSNYLNSTLSPSGMAFGPDGNLYVAIYGGGSRPDTIDRFDGLTGAALPLSGTSGAVFADLPTPAPGAQANIPGGLVFGPDHDIYVLDEIGASRTTAASTSLLRYDGTTGALLYNRPLGVDVGPSAQMTFGPTGYLYISDPAHSQILISDHALTSGAAAPSFSPVLTSADGLFAPSGLSVNPVDHELYVVAQGYQNSLGQILKDGYIMRFDISDPQHPVPDSSIIGNSPLVATSSVLSGGVGALAFAPDGTFITSNGANTFVMGNFSGVHQEEEISLPTLLPSLPIAGVSSSDYFTYEPAGLRSGFPLLPALVGGVFTLGTFIGAIGLGITAPLYVDPAPAVGYIYAVQPGGPNFTSVLLPTGLGTDRYELDLWNGRAFVFDRFLAAGSMYTFAAGGVDRFEIQGIPASAGLDPTDPGAFVTGLTFSRGGDLTMTMTPIPGATAVPEPASFLLMGGGMLGLAILARRVPIPRSPTG